MSSVEAAAPGPIPPALETVAAQLADLEARVTPGARLWLQEWARVGVKGGLGTLDEWEAAATRLRSAKARAVGSFLRERFQTVWATLRAMDAEAFGPLRARLAAGDYGPDELRADLARQPAYERDVFVSKLFDVEELPATERVRERDMVFYEATSVEAIFGLVEALSDEDVLYDLGSGCGLVVLLVGWLRGVRAVGVEFEPVYARIANARAEMLGLAHVTTVQADARTVRLDDASVVYLYHPFEGEILEAVLTEIRRQARARPIRVFARGAVAGWLVERPWLERVGDRPGRVVEYRSDPERASRDH